MSISALIIDDEPFAREDLRYLLKRHPDIRIIGEAGSLQEAKELLNKTDPDVIFLDVQLRGGSGFDLLDSIPSHTDIIIFTAYDELHQQVKNTKAKDYLLKPVTAERLAEAINKISAE